MTKDKERDDALIADRLWDLADCTEDRAARKLMLEAVHALRGDEQPKPDRWTLAARDVWDAVWKADTKEEREFAAAAVLRSHFPEAERPAVVVPEETGWLVETKFGPHIHYMGIQDPHPYWRDSKQKDEEFEPYGRRALVGLLSFNTDSNDGLRFARKVDAEAFIAAFGQLLTDPKATEHIWADKQLLDGAKGGE